MSKKVASSTLRYEGDVAGTAELLDLGRIPEVILNNGEAAARIWGRGDIAVMVYDLGAVSDVLRETLFGIGWDGTTRVFGVDRDRACATLGAAHDMLAAWAHRERDGVAQILVATNQGPVLVNFAPEGEGFGFVRKFFGPPPATYAYRASCPVPNIGAGGKF